MTKERKVSRLWDVDTLDTIGILGFGEYEVGVSAVAFSTNILKDELLVKKTC